MRNPARIHALRSAIHASFRPHAVIAMGSQGEPGEDEGMKQKRDLKDKIHRTLDVIDEPEDLQKIHDHVRGVAAACLAKKKGPQGGASPSGEASTPGEEY